MSFVVAFLAGAFLCNAMPHLTAGLRGEVFPSPFLEPRGKGSSSPLVNFLWNFLNALISLTLLIFHPFTPGFNVNSAALLVGVMVMGYTHPFISAACVGKVCFERDATRSARSAVWETTAVAVFSSLLAQLNATILNQSLSNLAQALHARGWPYSE